MGFTADNSYVDVWMYHELHDLYLFPYPQLDFEGCGDVTVAPVLPLSPI